MDLSTASGVNPWPVLRTAIISTKRDSIVATEELSPLMIISFPRATIMVRGNSFSITRSNSSRAPRTPIMEIDGGTTITDFAVVNGSLTPVRASLLTVVKDTA
jgi:hypothetical protein